MALALEAGEVCRSYFGTALHVDDKPHGAGPVTVADREADGLIRRGLEKAFPGDALLSEEYPDDLRRLGADRLWLVDPLDGTRQFVAGVPEYAVMIGLAVRGTAVLGVVHLPEEGLTYVAAEGEGAWEVRDGERRPLGIEAWTASRERSDEVVVAVSRTTERSPTRRVLECYGRHEAVYSGSVGRKAMLVASGRADIYLSLGSRSEHWDACAADAIVRLAGGVFSDFRGRKIVYNTESTRNASGLLACRKGLDSSIVETVARVLERAP